MAALGDHRLQDLPLDLSGTEVLLTTVGLVNGYANTGLTNGTTYWYQVSAVNAAGEGARSVEKSAKPVTVPSVPRFFTAAEGLVARHQPALAGAHLRRRQRDHRLPRLPRHDQRRGVALTRPSAW